MKKTIPGIDMALGIRQTGGNAALYMRFLKRFPQDDTFLQLQKALAEQDVGCAFLCAHTLKGLTQQLGISELFEPLHALCELLRTRDPQTLFEAQSICDAATPIYLRIVQDIARFT